MSATTLTNRETAYLCRSLSGMLHAGISAADACYLLMEEAEASEKALLTRLGQLLDEGSTLSDALAQCPGFPAATGEWICTGELTGHLEEALGSAAQFHEAQDESARQLRSALGYPGMLLVLMLTVVGVLLTQVLPVFDAVYASLGGRLTGIAAGLLGLGQGIRQAMPVLFFLLLILLVLFAGYRFCTPLRAVFSRSFGRLCDDRWLWREFANVRFVQAMAMGIRSGFYPEEAVALAAGLLKSSPKASARGEKCLELLREGVSLPDALRRTQLMPPSACRMLAVGLKSGSIDPMLDDITAKMHEHARQKLDTFLARIEPSMVLVSSILVGLILLSVMLPLLNILTALG